MSEAHLTYGLKDGILVHINNVENGLMCGCLCPKCGANLEAIQGEVRIPHFRHYKALECSGAQMTALHIKAQNLIAEYKRIMLPKFDGRIVKHISSIKYFNEVVLEQNIIEDGTSLRPDCIAKNVGGELWIEIYVTHKVNRDKETEIRRRGVYCIEIDLSDFLSHQFSDSELYDRLFKDSGHRRWVVCPVYESEDAKKVHERFKQIEKRRVDLEKAREWSRQQNAEKERMIQEKKERELNAWEAENKRLAPYRERIHGDVREVLKYREEFTQMLQLYRYDSEFYQFHIKEETEILEAAKMLEYNELATYIETTLLPLLKQGANRF